MTRLALLLAVMAAPAAVAQPALDMRSLDALFDRPPRVEVNLNGSLLRMASVATSDDDPEAAELIRGLRGIQVRVYSLDAARGALSESIAGYVRQFDAAGWETMVRVRPDDGESDDVTILVRAVGDGFDGMVVMALDETDGSASFVLIDGPVDISQLGRLSDRFAGTDLADVDAARAEALDEAQAARDAAAAARDAAAAARDAAERQRLGPPAHPPTPGIRLAGHKKEQRHP